MAVVPPEHPVVERLPVVGVGTAVEQEPGQRLPLRVPRLTARALLALPEAAGQGGERRGQALPEVSRRRDRRRRRAAAGPCDGVALRDTGVDEVEQRNPPERAALAGRRRRVGVQMPPHRLGVARGRGRVDAARRQIRLRRQEVRRIGPPRRLVRPGVLQAGEVAEPLDVVAGSRVDGVPAQLGRDLEVVLEPRPAREAVPAGDDQLRVGERERRPGRRAYRRGGSARPALTAWGTPTRTARSSRRASRRNRSRDGLLGRDVAMTASSRQPAVRCVGPKGGRSVLGHLPSPGRLSPFPRTGGALDASGQHTTAGSAQSVVPSIHRWPNGSRNTAVRPWSLLSGPRSRVAPPSTAREVSASTSSVVR